MSQFLRDCCAYMMSIGMSYDEYWNGDPSLARYYIDAEQYRFEKENQNMWIQGLYIYEAVSKAVGAMFSEKPSQVQPYSQRPYPFTEREREAERQRKIEYTMAWVRKGIERSEKNG